jgi:hypothetical protein
VSTHAHQIPSSLDNHASLVILLAHRALDQLRMTASLALRQKVDQSPTYSRANASPPAPPPLSFQALNAQTVISTAMNVSARPRIALLAPTISYSNERSQTENTSVSLSVEPNTSTCQECAKIATHLVSRAMEPPPHHVSHAIATSSLIRRERTAQPHVFSPNSTIPRRKNANSAIQFAKHVRAPPPLAHRAQLESSS